MCSMGFYSGNVILNWSEHCISFSRIQMAKRKLSAQESMLLNCGVGEDSWKSLGLQGDPTYQSLRTPVLNIHWKDWWSSWNSNILSIWCLTHWKRPWYWERLKAEGEGKDRGWDDWMASPTWWTWVWASSRSWWWTGKPGRLGVT